MNLTIEENALENETTVTFTKQEFDSCEFTAFEEFSLEHFSGSGADLLSKFSIIADAYDRLTKGTR